MSFMYINPGTADLLDVAGGTTVEGGKFNPYGGVAFWQPSSKKGVTIPEVPTEIYAKVTLAIRGALSSSVEAHMYAGNSNGWVIRESSGTWYLDMVCCNTQIEHLDNEEINLNFNGLNDILFHAKSGYSEQGLYSITINGVEVFKRNRTVRFVQSDSYAVPSDVVAFYSRNEKALFSNIIVSDTPVGCKDQVGILPVMETDTDMTANDDGSYTATAAGQRFIQTIDAEALINTYGGASHVSGLYISGNPAYTTGAELTKAIACGGKETLSDIASVTLSTDNTAKTLIGGAVSMTLEDLRGYRFGWKAGE